MILNRKVGITLSGGGVRGIAHLGVLKYLFDLGIHPAMISGTSAGALIGAFIAEGYLPDEILDISKRERFFSYSGISISRRGLFHTKMFEQITRKYIRHDSFEKLRIPLFVSVTDITNAESLIFSEGSLSFALKASACVPLVFEPVPFTNGSYLCDGGLLDNFPVEQIRVLCNKVIGVNVDPITKLEGAPTLRNMANRIIRLATSNKTVHSKTLCDVYIEPSDLNQFRTFDTKKIDEIFNVGYSYAQNFRRELLLLKAELA